MKQLHLYFLIIMIFKKCMSHKQKQYTSNSDKRLTLLVFYTEYIHESIIETMQSCTFSQLITHVCTYAFYYMCLKLFTYIFIYIPVCCTVVMLLK